MPILNKFRLRTPFEEFENYLGEEMNAFSGFFMEESKDANEINQATETPALEEVKTEQLSDSYWMKIKSMFKKGS